MLGWENNINLMDFLLGMCYLAQGTRGNTDGLVRVVGEKSAVEEVKHVVEMVHVFRV